ncbi:shikimate kinase [Ramlibacter solisilvae]|uniref:Shikimate kinase n=1 Tax=Ramlibacter tataouinensis TaxID=94132 RepID=A0A127JV76_9BURK|nr:shikimate kinase [Ramlibacter tataouinensis]AMO23779.1 shikimate kinase [Ramlibacter tataouinensis]
MIILTGLPGSGKSTVGRQLARRLGLNFNDSDHVIEQRLGCSIRSFFEREGEDAFRDVEEEVIAELCRQEGVLATGGGAVLRAANRQRLREAGQVVYLRASADDIFERIRHDKKRPLLQVADPLGRLRELFEARDPLYSETAHFIVATANPSVPALAKAIEAQLAAAGLLPARPKGR